MDMMEERQRDYAIYVRDFVMDPEYVKYLYENGLKKEAKRVQKVALREKMRLKGKSDEKLKCVIEEQSEKKRADRMSEKRMRREERMEREIAASKEIFWADLRKAQEEYKQKNIEKKEEKDLRLKEKEIESIHVTFQNSIIPTTISSSTFCALQVTHVSFSPKEVSEEKINCTFESVQEAFILKGKEPEDAKNGISQFEDDKNKKSKESLQIKIESLLVIEQVGKEELLSWDLTNIFLHNGVCSPANAIYVCSIAYSILKEGERTIPRDEPSEFNIIVFEPGG